METIYLLDSPPESLLSGSFWLGGGGGGFAPFLVVVRSSSPRRSSSPPRCRGPFLVAAPRPVPRRRGPFLVAALFWLVAVATHAPPINRICCCLVPWRLEQDASVDNFGFSAILLLRPAVF